MLDIFPKHLIKKSLSKRFRNNTHNEQQTLFQQAFAANQQTNFNLRGENRT